jgi:hypothetical protein
VEKHPAVAQDAADLPELCPKEAVTWCNRATRDSIPRFRSSWAAVALFAALRSGFGFCGTAWDGWANLHPDERHMVFVTQDLQRAVEGARAGEGRGWWDDLVRP